MLLINATTDNGCDEPSMEEWIAYDKEVNDAGIYVTGHALADLTTATSVHLAGNGERVVATDGPYAETREVLGGYYILDVPDLDAAIDWAARCPGARGGGRVVVRPLADFEN
ncbi:YciI family protein [Sinosporangium siamense]|nr:YciI family protein [Sinosporangium siamense]